jgi:hypothetical protein
MSLIFDSPNSIDIVDFSVIAKLAPEAWPGMRLQMQPSLYRINLSYNIVNIWQAIMEEKKEIQSPQRQPIISWILWRQGLMTRYCALSQAEAWAIDSFINKLNFKEVCEGLCQYSDEQEVGPLAAAFLKNWILGELIAKVIV